MRQRQDKNQIYDVALQQFSTYGYRKTTLEDIAAAMNMTGASLYSYAASKQNLYHDAVAYGLKKWQTYVLEAIEKADGPSEYFEELCRSSVEYLNEDKVLRTILKRDPDIFPMFPEADPYEDINKDSFSMLKEAIDKGVAAGVFAKIDTLKCTRILFSIYKTLIIETYIKYETEEIMDAFPVIMQVILNGLLKR